MISNSKVALPHPVNSVIKDLPLSPLQAEVVILPVSLKLSSLSLVIESLEKCKNATETQNQ